MGRVGEAALRVDPILVDMNDQVARQHGHDPRRDEGLDERASRMLPETSPLYRK